MNEIFNDTIPDFLQIILQSRQKKLLEQKKEITVRCMKERAEKSPTPIPFLSRFQKDKTNIIAELKKASPSKGMIRPDLDCSRLAADFERTGACALSVLTEERFFLGSAENLRITAQSSSLPILCKDFIFDEYQIDEARSLGASAVLLIAALLSFDRLCILTDYAQSIGLSVLGEAHNRQETESLLKTSVDLIGINARNLRTFETSLEVTKELIPLIPPNRYPIAESAIQSIDDIHELQNAGACGFLIGELLMRSSVPELKLKELLK